MTHIPSILIVDDDAALLQALPQALYLRFGQIKVDTCDSAQSALKQIQEHEYDSIVSDIKMPGMDGLALLAKIQALRPETPTLLITGHGEHDLAIQALRGGAYDFIQKPIDRDYFVAALRRSIQTYQLRSQVREQQRALEDYTQSLERLVQERTRELVAANVAKDEFLSMASHELKTPLSSLKGMTQLLKRRLERANSPEVTNLATMERSIRRMEILLQDLLGTALHATGRFTLHRTHADLVEIAQHALQEHAAGLNPAPTLLVDLPHEPVEAEVDVHRISQVFTNLLSNAYKYSPKDAPIRVTLREVGDECIFSVQDMGVGIPPEEQEHIFERFYRPTTIEVQTGSSVGLGLGLHIAQKIIEQHDGRIEVESVPGKGSTFSVTLPRAPASIKADEPSLSIRGAP